MKQFASKITSKGQITLPVAVRRSLGVSPSDKVLFIINDDGTVEVQPVRFSIMDLQSSVPAIPGREFADIDEMIAEAMEEAAERIIREMEEG